MGIVMVVLLMFVPAVIAVAAIAAAIYRFNKLDTVEPSRRPWHWLGIGLLVLLALGIGSCYACVWGPFNFMKF